MEIPNNTTGIVFAIIASFSWAIFAFTIKYALDGASVLKTAAGVNGLNAITVTIVTLLIIPPSAFIPEHNETYIHLGLAGLFHIGISRIIFYTAIDRLGPNRSIPVAMSYPIITALTSAWLLGEAITWQIFFGLILLLAGITFIVNADAPRTQKDKNTAATWRLVGWVCAGFTSLLWGVAATFFKKAALDMHPLAVSSIALWIGFIVSFFAARLLDPEGVVPARSWRWILVSACCQTAAVPFYILAFTHTLAVRVTAIVSAQPLIVIPIGWLIMRESENITPRLIAGATLAVGGTILVII
ncbi:MAG: DMT family transporter [Nitrospinaceae bacterium]|jgi:drug/metabolite transporter (DMT)-like permease|nr:DMT family transporter [Nitrospinaceae bacterium]MBT3435048.1 DMT family transporter [Nitrospinaceae bacterium]MBT3822775.1 DMT family transporter [Nitrospinaceae bacterium]MBT4095067.1 DMT family transporter [Nitrospinaceae bacterium]MBT4431547.1 DMT family transporter [Nitrospinaceae bacterium]